MSYRPSPPLLLFAIITIVFSSCQSDWDNPSLGILSNNDKSVLTMYDSICKSNRSELEALLGFLPIPSNTRSITPSTLLEVVTELCDSVWISEVALNLEGINSMIDEREDSVLQCLSDEFLPEDISKYFQALDHYTKEGGHDPFKVIILSSSFPEDLKVCFILACAKIDILAPYSFWQDMVLPYDTRGNFPGHYDPLEYLCREKLWYDLKKLATLGLSDVVSNILLDSALPELGELLMVADLIGAASAVHEYWVCLESGGSTLPYVPF